MSPVAASGGRGGGVVGVARVMFTGEGYVRDRQTKMVDLKGCVRWS
jgi:hypothetical protein